MTRDEILTQMRERAHYPATARDLARILKVPREQRATVHPTSQGPASPAAISCRCAATGFGLPEKMDLVVGRLHVNPAGFGFVDAPSAGATATRSPTSTFRPSPSPRRCTATRVVARVEKHTEKGLEGRLVKILRARPRAHGRAVRGGCLGPRLRGAVRSPPRDRHPDSDRPGLVRRARRHGSGVDDPVADARRAGPPARSARCSGASTSPAWTRRSSSASSASPTRIRRTSSPRRAPSAPRCASRTSRAAPTSGASRR